MTFSLYDLLGSLGAATLILAYFLLQLDRIKSTSFWYSLLNAVGAALILVSLIFDFNLPSLIIEAFWLIISLYGIIKFFLQRKL